MGSLLYAISQRQNCLVAELLKLFLNYILNFKIPTHPNRRMLLLFHLFPTDLEASKQPWPKGRSSQTQGGTETTKVKVMDGPRLSPVFLKHKFLSGVEEIMKLEENVENQNPLTWKSLLTLFFFFFFS